MDRSRFAFGMTASVLTIASVCQPGAAQNIIRPSDALEVAEESGSDADQRAKELAVGALAKTLQIDKLPRFFIRARAGTHTFKRMADATDNRLENLLPAVDKPVVEEDWGRYESTFAWDEKHFLSELLLSGLHAPDQAEGKALKGNSRSRYSSGGTWQLGAERSQQDDQLSCFSWNWKVEPVGLT